jgi:hypothetical protein
MTENKILKLIKYAKKIDNSKIHFGIQINDGNIEITFLDSVSLDIVKENLDNQPYKEVKKILKSYKVLSSIN